MLKFGHSEHSKKRSKFLPLVLFRMLLSLSMLLLLGVLLYQAFLYFSGVKPDQDPLTFLKSLSKDPKTTLIALVASEEPSKIFSQLKEAGVPIPITPVPSNNSPQAVDKPLEPSGRMILKFALMADSHNDNEKLAEALALAKEKGAKFVIGLGDYTDTGTLEELQKAQAVFENAKIPFYLTAGDHDLWDARDKTSLAAGNFNQVFGSPYQTFVDSGIRFVIVYNSDNYLGLDSLEMEWLKEVLEKAEENPPKLLFIFLHEPLAHPTSNRLMGGAPKTGEESNQKIIEQKEELLRLFKRAPVTEIFAGDIHAYSRYEAEGLKMTTVGALTRERNTQNPRFSLVEVFENGGYNVLDLELK